MIAAKLLLVAVTLVLQLKWFPVTEAASDEALDSISLPAENPERVLAERALAAHGLCSLAMDRSAPSAPALHGMAVAAESSESASICARP